VLGLESESYVDVIYSINYCALCLQEAPEKLQAKEKLSSWLNKSMKIKMSDGRTLVGMYKFY
jgi:hypothetical protein